MKNIFDFATKELSQDAFLRWFIESDANDSGKKLLAKFIDESDYKKIEIIGTSAQLKDMDICVDFKLDGESSVLIIEDKIGTSTHDDQLHRYMIAVDKWNEKHNGRSSYFVYYKPRVLSDDEVKAVKEIELKDHNWAWQIFDINKIYEFFKEYEDSDNLIIKYYSEHVRKIKESCDNVKLPKENNILEWRSYFENVLKNKMVYDQVKYGIEVGEYRALYATFVIYVKGKDNKITPYFEIRSRDCLNNNLTGRILIYKKEMSESQIQDYKKNVELQHGLIKRENHKKQIASTKELSYKDEKDFIELIQKLVAEFIDITSRVLH